MSSTIKIPLFPLGVVLFPAMPLPLHIFEERYKLMISECIESDSVFGVVYYTGENFYRIGCTSMIKQILKKFDDGRMNILAEGRERFSIHHITNDKPYLQGEVEIFDDKTSENKTELRDLSAAASQLYKQTVKNLTPQESLELIGSLEPKEFSFLIAASSGFSLNEKQAFLEMTSTAERLKKSTSALMRMSERQKTTKEIEGMISGNGYLHNKIL
ncbi:hypothetical protein F9K33_11190 [bacterium]|nr:MAG: hypothetical protein F9K33_11190 [bacterium]